MTEIEFTPEEEAAIRRALGFGPDDREVTPADIVAAIEATGIVLDAERAWLDGEDP